MPTVLSDDHLAKALDTSLALDIIDPYDSSLNKFKGLDIQEPSQDCLDARNVATENKQSHRYEPNPLDILEKEYLATHCLFQDVARKRSAVRWLWQ